MKFSPSKNRSHFEAIFKKNKDIWELKQDQELLESLTLLPEEMDFDQPDRKFNTILYLAVANNRLKTVAYLLSKRKVNPNVKVSELLTATHVAAASGHLEVLKLLIACPAIQLAERDTFGETPLFRAVGNAPDMTVLEIAKLILSVSPASLSIANEDNVFPIDIALQREHLAMIELFLEKGANVSKRCSSVAVGKLMEKTVSDTRFPGASVFYLGTNRRNNLRDCATLIINAYNKQHLADDLKDLAQKKSGKTVVQSCSEEIERIFPNVKGQTVLYEKHSVVDVAVKTDEDTVEMREYLKKYDIDVQKGKNTITKIFTIRLKASEEFLGKLKTIPTKTQDLQLLNNMPEQSNL